MNKGGISCAKCVLLIGMLAGAALFHVWQKVEMAGWPAASVRLRRK